MDQDPLIQFHHLLKQKFVITEKQFWELSNDEGHSAEQEIELAKELMMQERHIQLIDQTIKLRNQDKTLSFAFPLKYAMNLIQNQDIIEEYKQYNVIDVSEEFEKINLNTITEEQVKGYLIMKFDDTGSQKSDAWEDDLGEVVEVDNQELEALEKEVDQQEEKIMEEEEQMIKQQPELIEQIEENHVDPNWKIDESKALLKIHNKCICTFSQNPISKDMIASGSEDDYLKIIKLSNQKVIFEKKYDETVGLVDFSYDGKYVAAGILTGKIYIYLLNDMSEKILDGSQTEPSVLKWHPKGNVILAGFQDSTLWMWNGVNGEVMSVFAGHEAEITCGGFTLDGKLVVSGSADQSFRVWKPNSSEQIVKISSISHKHNYHKDDVVCFVQHHKQPIISTGSSDSTIAFINFEDGKVIGKSDPLGDSIVELCFIGSNQPIIVAGDILGSIYIYNWNSMKLIEKLCLCKNSITKILFYNQQFHISSLDGKIVTFDVRQMHNYNVLQAKSGIYEMIVEEGWILVGCENGYIYVY
ncbi:unnamed protein product [Paramecium primaurelia]|uniref:Uncharacterized protein n=1 Tax=Paramecium primaurelia TaxID=5886 RepID=A0A8S1JV59_PARPR|nr:unnamed protein product [Paramecium primaurelia]